MVRESTVIALRNAPKRYNVIYGRKDLYKDVGAGEIVKRAVTQAGLNSYVPRTANAIGEISEFLTNNQGKKTSDIEILPRNMQNNPYGLVSDAKFVSIDGDPTQYKLYSIKNDYYLWIPTDRFNNNRCLHIKADNDENFKYKLDKLFNNPTTRAKLDFKITNIPIGFRNCLISGLPKHEVYLDEAKLTGAFQANAYKAIGIDGDNEEFDSQLGTVDRKQMSYFAPLTSFEGYSGRKEKPVTIRDDTWVKSHEAAQFVNASHECRELLETIIAQTYSGQELSPKFTADMCVRMREDYIHNIHGYDTLNIRSKGQTLLPYQEIISQWESELSNDPLRGGRFWENHAPSNQEVVLMMYKPQIDGKAKLRYDNEEDRKILFKLIDVLKIKPKDRQYTMNYARKALGIKIARKLLQEEIANIKLDDPILSPSEKAYTQKKWQDLTYIKDQLFNNAGDLRNSLRKGNVGFPAYIEAISLSHIPNIKPQKGRVVNGLPYQEGFVKTATDGLGRMAENYPYYKNLYGIIGQEYFTLALKKAFSKNLFNRNVPESVTDNAVTMLTEAFEHIGRRLKLFNEVYDKDASLGAISNKFVSRLMRADFNNLGDLVKRQKKRIKQLVQGKQDASDTGVKRLALQGEGLMFEEEVFANFTGAYMGDNNGILSTLSDNKNMADYEGLLGHIYWQEADKMVSELLPTMIDFARFMRVQQTGFMKQYQQTLLSVSPKKWPEVMKKIYECPEMVMLDSYMRKAAHQMALQYFVKNKHTLNDGADEDLRILFKQVKMEYVNLLQMVANVTAMLAYNPAKRPKTMICTIIYIYRLQRKTLQPFLICDYIGLMFY